MNEILPFAYADAQTAEFCESKAANIRLAVRTLRENIISIGQDLLAVKAALPHGQFGAWVEARVGLSRSTSLNYMAAALAVDKNPKLYDFEPSILYMLTSGTPQSAVDELVERGPMPVAEARIVVERHRAAAWEESCRDRLGHGDACDAGDVLFEIQQAMSAPRRENAVRLAREYCDLLARLSGRATDEFLAELGITWRKRIGVDAPNRVSDRLGDTAWSRPNAQLKEDDEGRRIILWGSGDVQEPIVIARFPKVWDATADAWQALAIEACVQATHARTMDDVHRELI